MKCAEFMQMIDAYCAEDLDPASVRQCASHTEKCVSCRRELAYARKLLKAMQSLPELKAPRGFEDKIESRIFGKMNVIRRIFRPVQVKVALSVAAVLLVAFVLFIMPKDYIYKKNSADLAVNTDESYKASYGFVDMPDSKESAHTAQQKSKTVMTKPSGGSLDDRTEEKTDVSIIIAMNDVQAERMELPSSAKPEELRLSADESIADDKIEDKKSLQKSSIEQDFAKKDSARSAQSAGASMPVSPQLQQSAGSQVNSIVQQVGGTVIPSQNQSSVKRKGALKEREQKVQKNSVTAQIPVSNYTQFIELLSKIASVKPVQKSKLPTKGSVQVEIQIEDEQKPELK